MGMFDSVRVRCECGELVEFQSKSGPCELLIFTLENCPEEVLQDVNRHSPVFCPCGRWLEVDRVSRQLVSVPPPPPSGPLSIRVSDGKVLDFKRMQSDGGGGFLSYHGSKACGEFDPEYVKDWKDKS